MDEATVESRGTSLREAIRRLIQIVAPHLVNLHRQCPTSRKQLCGLGKMRTIRVRRLISWFSRSNMSVTGMIMTVWPVPPLEMINFRRMVRPSGTGAPGMASSPRRAAQPSRAASHASEERGAWHRVRAICLQRHNFLCGFRLSKVKCVAKALRPVHGVGAVTPACGRAGKRRGDSHAPALKIAFQVGIALAF